MNLYWTNKKHFRGLKHFVVINELVKNKNCFVELVSVLDSNINLTISRIELEKSEEWIMGWKEYSKKESISNEYFKKHCKKENFQTLFLKHDSPFNIS